METHYLVLLNLFTELFIVSNNNVIISCVYNSIIIGTFACFYCLDMM